MKNQRPTRITTRENPTSKNEIGFILYPEKEDGTSYKITNQRDAFIPTDDFDFVIGSFRSVFPLKNNWNDEIENSFDPCGHNYFDLQTTTKIINEIKNSLSKDVKIEKFKHDLIIWLEDKISYADYIVVYGNL